MSIASAEQLKKEWTDKYVVVDEKTPELKRFSGLTGTVKTINMNGRALVEFDGAVDIGWYDIDPSFLKIVSEPLKKKAPEKHEKPASAAAAPKAAAAAEAAKPAGEKKLSPLELARQQGAAAKAAGDAAKKPSPLDQARAQGAAKAEAAPAATVETAAAPAAKPAAAKAAAGGGAREKPGSTAEIIALARSQGAFKG
jgi:hypothetical protein